MIRPPPRSPLFPSTTLFRSAHRQPRGRQGGASDDDHAPTRHRRERAGALHRGADELQDVERTVANRRSEEHTSKLQSRLHLVCRLLLEKKKKKRKTRIS